MNRTDGSVVAGRSGLQVVVGTLLLLGGALLMASTGCFPTGGDDDGDDNGSGEPTATPTVVPTATLPAGVPTPTPTPAAGQAPSPTPTVTPVPPTPTITPTATNPPTSTPTITGTPTQTRTPTPTLVPLVLNVSPRQVQVGPGVAVRFQYSLQGTSFPISCTGLNQTVVRVLQTNGQGVPTEIETTPTDPGSFSATECGVYTASQVAGVYEIRSVFTLPDLRRAEARATVIVTGLGNVQSVAAGGYHNTALTVDGRVVSWGLDGNGQLGNGGGFASRATPQLVRSRGDVRVLFSTTARAVDAGLAHSVVAGTGFIGGFGSNSSGQLGQSVIVGSVLFDYNAVLIPGVMDEMNPQNNTPDTCRITRNFAPIDNRTFPFYVPMLAISYETTQSFIEGIVSPPCDQFIDAPISSASFSVPPNAPEPVTPAPVSAFTFPSTTRSSIVQVEAGNTFTAMILDRHPAFDYAGRPWEQLETASNVVFGVGGIFPLKDSVSDFPAISDIPGAPGQFQQTGGSNPVLLPPVPNTPVVSGEMPDPLAGQYLTNITKIAAGGQFVILMQDSNNDGQTDAVWAYGRNPDGQLGNGTIHQDVRGPYRVRTVAGYPNSFLGPDVVDITAGADYAAALLADGTVLTWGWNQFGQLGNNRVDVDGLANSLGQPIETIPVQVRGVNSPNAVLTNVRRIKAGSLHCVAELNDASRTVVTWGNNNFGQLGIGQIDDTGTGVLTPQVVVGPAGIGTFTLPPGNITLSSIDGGLAHSVGLSSNNRVFTWGSNIDLQLGLPGVGRAAVPMPVSAPEGDPEVAP